MRNQNYTDGRIDHVDCLHRARGCGIRFKFAGDFIQGVDGEPTGFNWIELHITTTAAAVFELSRDARHICQYRQIPRGIYSGPVRFEFVFRYDLVQPGATNQRDIGGRVLWVSHCLGHRYSRIAF